MRKMFPALTMMLLCTLAMNNGYSQKKDTKQPSQLKTMTWTTKSEAAKKLADEGSNDFMNIERPQAYEKFKQALDIDPNFTVALVFMSNLTEGETKKAYSKRAL